MSIRRIESAYATFFGKDCVVGGKKLTGTQMAVLIALSYCANERDNEKCYPGSKYLQNLTHFSENTITKCRDELRKMGIINWRSGGKTADGKNQANDYRFLFPLNKMESARSRYEPIAQDVDKSAEALTASKQPATTPPTCRGTPPSTWGTPPPCVGVPSPTTWGTPPHHVGTNTEYKTETNPNINSESNSSETDVISIFSSSGVLSDVNAQSETDAKGYDPRTVPIVVQHAMKVCNVSDAKNLRIFKFVTRGKNEDVVDEEITAFESEIRQDEHTNAKNLASILVKRLKKIPIKQG